MNEFLVRKGGVGGFHTAAKTTQVLQSLNGNVLYSYTFIFKIVRVFISVMAEFKHKR
jgi:hypothetical protein